MTSRERDTPAVLSRLRNIGPRSARRLAAAGIDTVDDLRALGAAEAYRRTKLANPEGVSLNLLWALQGALLDINWRDLPDEIRATLEAELGGSPS